MQYMPDKHRDSVDVLLNARFSTGSLFPLFYSLTRTLPWGMCYICNLHTPSSVFHTVLLV